jgi:hypothetical protein
VFFGSREGLCQTVAAVNVPRCSGEGETRAKLLHKYVYTYVYTHAHTHTCVCVCVDMFILTGTPSGHYTQFSPPSSSEFFTASRYTQFFTTCFQRCSLHPRPHCKHLALHLLHLRLRGSGMLQAPGGEGGKKIRSMILRTQGVSV